MSFPAIQIEKREASGRSPVRRLRESGKVPGIIYGHNDKNEPELVQVEEKPLRKALEAGRKFFSVEGGNAGTVNAFVAEVQVNELTDEILHVDFQRVEDADRVTLRIPVIIKGTPAGARLGGRLEVFLHNIRITCSPTNILEEFVLDVSAMEIGNRATLGGLSLPEGVKTVGQESTTVCIVHPPKGSRGPKGAKGPEAEASTEEAPGDEAPAEGGDSGDAPAES